MGKRLIRIFQKEIPSRAALLVDLELNLVLTNNKTINGVLKKIENNFFLLQGKLGDKHRVKLEEISEIIYDKEASF